MAGKNKRLEQLMLMLKNNPKDEFLLFAVAKEHEKLHDETTALDYFLLLQQSSPDYVGCYYHLARLYEKLENFDKALETYSKGMQVAKRQDDQHAYSELANAKINLELEMD